VPGSAAARELVTRIAISQSNYIPWKGYFDLINLVDEFVLLDEVQYTRRDWRNRNRVKTAQGPVWLTIPVQIKGRYLQRIDETLVSERGWERKHLKTILQSYRQAPSFDLYAERLTYVYGSVAGQERLSDINRRFIEAICEWLGITTRLSWSTDHQAQEGRNERLLSICLALGASEYVSGPAAASYLDVELFRGNGVEVSWMDYDGYPEYPQPHPPFEHAVSVLDLLLSVGEDASHYLKTFSAVT
jgi:WbqC-like protein family